MLFKQTYIELKRLLSFLRKRRRSYWIGLIGDSVSNAAIAILLSFVIHDLLEFSVHRDRALLLNAIYLISGTFVMLAVLSPLFSYIYHRAVKQTMVEVRTSLFDKVTRLPQRYHESNHSGDVVSRMTNDVQAMEQTYTEHLKSVVVECLTLVGSLVLMFVLDPRFAVILLLLGVVTVLVNVRFARSLRKVSDDLQGQMGGLTERLTDLVNGIQVIKMFSLYRIITKKYDDRNAEVTSSVRKQGHQTALLDSINFLINFLSLGGVLAVGIILFAAGKLELGLLGQMVQLQSGISLVFLQMGSIVTLLQQSLAGASRVYELLDAEEEPKSYGEATSTAGELKQSEAIVLEQVGFRYAPDSPAIHDCSLCIRQGQTAALIGESGGGKSTILKLLLGFYPVQSGELRLLGKRYGEYTLQELRNLIAYVPQDAYLFQGTIADNLRMGKPEATEEELIGAARLAYAHDFICQLPEGYETSVGERGSRLSGGQRQRLAIARAILKNAPILLLDEATSALDTESEQEVQQALHMLKQGRTTLVVAHRLSTVEKADLLLVVEEGQVKEAGTHEELLALKGRYERLYLEQFRKTREAAAVS
jgi:ATP-binding cassette, subfamily B, bacterial